MVTTNENEGKENCNKSLVACPSLRLRKKIIIYVRKVIDWQLTTISNECLPPMKAKEKQ